MSRRAGAMAALWLAVLCGSAGAQPAANLDGEWEVQIRTKQGQNFTAVMRMQGATGVYQFGQRSVGDPCVIAPTPVVSQPTAEGMELRFERSRALTGCADFTLPFQRLDDGRWQGTAPNGAVLTLRRKAPG